MKTLFQIGFALLLISSLCGCSRIHIQEKGQAEREKRQAFLRDLDAKKGILSIDDALSTWGPPSTSYEGDKIIVFVWRDERFRTLYFHGEHISSTSRVSNGSELSVIFDKTNRRMADWKFNEW